MTPSPTTNKLRVYCSELNCQMNINFRLRPAVLPCFSFVCLRIAFSFVGGCYCTTTALCKLHDVKDGMWSAMNATMISGTEVFAANKRLKISAYCCSSSPHPHTHKCVSVLMHRVQGVKLTPRFRGQPRIFDAQ
jgi:hypothetical protein